MADDKDDAGIRLGVYGRSVERPRFTSIEVVAAVVSIAWLVSAGALILALGGPRESAVLAWLTTAVSLCLPVALVWVAAALARQAEAQREEHAALRAELDALRHARQTGTTAPRIAPPPSAPAATGVPEGRQSPRPETTAPAERTPAPARADRAPEAARLRPAPADPQSSFALDGAPEQTDLSSEDRIRALNFPDDTRDADGFRALRRGLNDPQIGKLVRASQDILTLLSEDGIYMDDLAADRARPDVWRRFAEGERGRAVADIGGIRDRGPLGLAATRMREDVVFRDAAHHFLRLFDREITAFVPTATDEEIAALGDTRTARAFMLLGRVVGTFD